MDKRYYYHTCAKNNGNGTWSCPDCGFTANDPTIILNDINGCTVGHPPCSHCGGAHECAPDCAGIAKALSGEGVHIAGSLAPTDHEA